MIFPDTITEWQESGFWKLCKEDQILKCLLRFRNQQFLFLLEKNCLSCTYEFIVCVCVCVETARERRRKGGKTEGEKSMCVHPSAHREVRGQPTGVGSLLPSRESQGLKDWTQAVSFGSISLTCWVISPAAWQSLSTLTSFYKQLSIYEKAQDGGTLIQCVEMCHNWVLFHSVVFLETSPCL